ncbi:MAG TPA: hypothetical protein DHW61_14115 [Lachnoclostridium phytofermentans]|uniref:Uncharacterized protein n=1 Tax=Lachnoclostridium phytofermentans TaxID=66219 RepID=A0A3D2X8P7_9FIRM|nr:hypothetical protein [Lachnoclostridium phytofermentans]
MPTCFVLLGNKKDYVMPPIDLFIRLALGGFSFIIKENARVRFFSYTPTIIEPIYQLGKF